MSRQKEKALELAKIKSVREQAEIFVYEDKNSQNDDYIVSPVKFNKDGLEFFDSFDSSLEEGEDESGDVVSIDDHSEIEEGDQILINENESDQVIRVTDRQIITLSGAKFRRSDGVIWGNNNSEKKITHQIKI